MKDAGDPALPTRFDARWALFLDVDGTLLDHADEPAGVVLASGLLATLKRLCTYTQGALALVSGRSIADLDKLFTPCTFAAAGQHGLEIRDTQGQIAFDEQARARNAVAVEALMRQTRKLVNITVEDKGLSVALHYRRAPYLRDRLLHLTRGLARTLGSDFRVIDGNMAFEIKSGPSDKGSAIRKLLNDPVFHTRTPIYVGDDTTDEDGFALVNAMNGLSVKVGLGPSIATQRAANPTEVRRWLTLCADQIGETLDHD